MKHTERNISDTVRVPACALDVLIGAVLTFLDAAKGS